MIDTFVTMYGFQPMNVMLFVKPLMRATNSYEKKTMWIGIENIECGGEMGKIKVKMNYIHFALNASSDKRNVRETMICLQIDRNLLQRS